MTTLRRVYSIEKMTKETIYLSGIGCCENDAFMLGQQPTLRLSKHRKCGCASATLMRRTSKEADRKGRILVLPRDFSQIYCTSALNSGGGKTHR
jgi:hypothetical protein